MQRWSLQLLLASRRQNVLEAERAEDEIERTMLNAFVDEIDEELKRRKDDR